MKNIIPYNKWAKENSKSIHLYNIEQVFRIYNIDWEPAYIVDLSNKTTEFLSDFNKWLGEQKIVYMSFGHRYLFKNDKDVILLKLIFG